MLQRFSTDGPRIGVCCRRARGGDEGIAAVEFALLLPIFIILIVAAVVLGHAQFVRSQVATQAYFQARACSIALERSEEAPDCQALAQTRFSSRFAGDCSPVEVQVKLDSDLEDVAFVKLVEVQARCRYTNAWVELMAARLGSELTFRDFTVYAAVPYSLRAPEELGAEEEGS